MKKNITSIVLSFFALGLTNFLLAGPPKPEEGYRWVLQESFSDEFNGTSLDKTKWRDSFDGWKGRSPAKFDPSTVFVRDGSMQIVNKKLDQADGDYTIGGGAVQSLSDQAFYGYYECNFKASRINMSTTFWMSNGKVDVNGVTKKSNGVDCPKDRFSQELDICESVGGAGNFSSKFRTQQNFNTHYRYIDCDGSPEKFYSAGNNSIEGNGQEADASIEGESWEDFHTYACYWKSANVVDFYTDNRYAGTVNVSTEVVDNPFPRPMKINMVTETYNWAKPYPTDAELANNTINTSYYNWIRAYKLVSVDEDLGSNAAGFVDLYNENVVFDDFATTQEAATNYSFPVLYQANVDREIYLILKDQGQNIIKTEKYTAYAGYGNAVYDLNLDEVLSNGLYSITAEIRPVNGDVNSTIYSETKPLTISGESSPTLNVSFVNAPAAIFTDTQVTMDLNYTVDDTRDLVLVLTSPEGNWLGAKTTTVSQGSATVSVTIDLANAPTAAQDYKFSAVIREVGGDWTTNILAEDIFVDILEPGTCMSENVVNGCFESNDLTGWIQWGAGSRSVAFQENVFEGNYALMVSGVGAAEQVVEGLKENTTYRLKAQVKIEGSQFLSLGVKEFGATQETALQIVNTSYDEKVVEFTTGSGVNSAKIFFYSPNQNGVGYADNFTIEEVFVTEVSSPLDVDIAVYPNPTEDYIFLSQISKWCLYNIHGQRMAEGYGNELDLSVYPKGIYWVSIEDEKYKVVKK